MNQQIRLGKYRLFQHLASGGMGEVYLAVNEGPAGFAKNVVVKRILANVASDPAFVTMFLNEARLAALIEHPNVVQIFELGFEENTYFIAMEFVHGRSLRHLRHQLAERKRDVPPELAARICSQALQGLHHAHTLTDGHGEPLQIVHRDVSPDNVLIGFNGVVKVVDFGIAKAAVNVSTTQAGSVKGKFAYMAPEQISGGGVIDGRVDVYGMGVVLYELLAGQRPFSASTEPGLIRAILQDDITPLVVSNPNIPEALSDIVMRALSRNISDRYASAEDMSLALEGYVQSTGKTVTSAHVSALLKELFPEQSGIKTPLPPSPRVSYGLTPGVGSTPGAAAVPGSSGSGTGARYMGSGVYPHLAEAEAILPDIEIVTDSGEDRKRRRSGKGPWIAAAVGGAALLAGAAVILPQRTSTAEPAPVVQAPQPSAVAEKTAPPKQPEMKVAEAPHPVPSAAAPATEPEAEPAGTSPAEAAAAAPAPKATPTSSPSRSKSIAHAGPQKRASEKVVERAPVKAEPEVAATGRVVLRVNPWAEVVWAGRNLGVTPMDALELPTGTQVITLRNPDLKIEKKVSVKVQADREVILKADLLE